ncbi:hypothetical protein SAMN05192551_1216 [Tindallia magadiensis]|uniref:DUF6602 domain-containing protein n=1 Tax=Tindallia magadiensis TaxID=69895 RepID=A0A1I3I433_9FIRM|nr:DUF6602 domain-containing protein [Tindallia magadiensis]SFI42672.1 hypothetical protein SAMN05192551_1216 [Tindallia magadiensis]
MDVKVIFREAAKKLLSDFDISAQINHSGLTGTYREDAIKNFLKEGRLPSKFGIGSGEIVGPTSNISRQSDLVIYDRQNCPVLIFSDSIQIFPSEAVYGIIEVKSQLSKQKLIEGLENIASFKMIVPKGVVTQRNGIMTMSYEKSRPFGIIVAYSLSNNSLDSLVKNLTEYESTVDSDLWPNMIVVINEGIIWHSNSNLKTLVRSEDLNNTVYPTAIHFKQDTLFEFYLTLFDLLKSTDLGDINLRKYKDLPKQVGNHFITGHDRFVNRDNGTVSALNERFINRVFDYCQAVGKLTHRDILMLEFGRIPDGLGEEELKVPIYYYDPDNLPGLHQVEVPFSRDDKGQFTTTSRMRIPNCVITIDGEPYEFPQAYIEPEDLTIIPGKTPDEL